MGLGIHIKGLTFEEVDSFTDDANDSFRRMCHNAPWESLRSGVSQFGYTVFNTTQLHRLIEELESLPESEITPIVRKVIDAAQQTIRRSGYLHFIGD
ncbi:hypothetical protein EYS09_26650 [Streptomyces kasugaensis]|uniref:Uncharacterized protein n=1 Tax=Streptomyces kasugaensis TaxID=1946 RepID=A0A4V2JI08_STRKA|nr:hypothetical protein EYS09_26650 [Streptomyces kasugaensis]